MIKNCQIGTFRAYGVAAKYDKSAVSKTKSSCSRPNWNHTETAETLRVKDYPIGAGHVVTPEPEDEYQRS